MAPAISPPSSGLKNRRFALCRERRLLEQEIEDVSEAVTEKEKKRLDEAVVLIKVACRIIEKVAEP